ncbi:hypothetical protein RCL_jg2284.t1 [Rhizophagus clarus]|uniref:Uncharacterized protein n=1 Tax=Rhizophagus clarus TaxID=94130 RepID=A0A8H3KP39_9GLOM|nr:hypothetical protein RCL_jg2284.t1 [Rhizophagus clarus]
MMRIMAYCCIFIGYFHLSFGRTLWADSRGRIRNSLGTALWNTFKLFVILLAIYVNLDTYCFIKKFVFLYIIPNK